MTRKKTLLAELQISGRSKSDLKEMTKQIQELVKQLKAAEEEFKKFGGGGTTARNLGATQKNLKTQLGLVKRDLVQTAPTIEAKKKISEAIDNFAKDLFASVSTSLKNGYKKTLKDFEKEAFAVSHLKRPTKYLNERSFDRYKDPNRLKELIQAEKINVKAAKDYLKSIVAAGKEGTSLHSQAKTHLANLMQGITQAEARMKGLIDAAKPPKVPKSSEPKVQLTPAQKAKNKAYQGELDGVARRRHNGGANLFANQFQVLRNFLVLGGGLSALSGSASFVTELDRAFRQLQSIVNLTNQEMEQLSETLIAVSEKTKFTAVEVTEAAVILGQAGLGREQIENSIEAITLFATAVGSDLKSAVDLATSTLGVYNKDASQMTNIVDEMTVAINNSKLNLEKLTLGLQYSGNIASQSNVTFEETVAALAAMANSGIRAGSTLGTGLRQVLIALKNPSAGFSKRISELGLSMSDLDISTHGLINVLKRLSIAGFTVNDAMKTMQVRAASAYGAFVNNIDSAEELTDKMKLGGAASKANATQMKAFTNQLDRFGSTAKSVVYEAFKPLLEVLTISLDKASSFLSVLKQFTPVLSTIATPLAVLGGLLGLKSLGRLAVGGFNMLATAGSLLTGGSKANSPEKLNTSEVIKKASTSKNFLKSAATLALGLLKSNLVTLVVTTALSSAVLGYSYFTRKSVSRDKVDKARLNLNEAQSQESKYTTLYKKVDKALISVIKKRELLMNDASGTLLTKEIEHLNKEYQSFGLYIDKSTDSFEKLVAKVQEFRSKLKGLSEDFQAKIYAPTGLANKAAFEKFQLYVEQTKNKESGLKYRKLKGQSALLAQSPYANINPYLGTESLSLGEPDNRKSKLLQSLLGSELYKSVFTGSQYSKLNAINQKRNTEEGLVIAEKRVSELGTILGKLNGLLAEKGTPLFDSTAKTFKFSPNQLEHYLKTTASDISDQLEKVSASLEVTKKVLKFNSEDYKQTQAAIRAGEKSGGLKEELILLSSNFAQFVNKFATDPRQVKDLSNPESKAFRLLFNKLDSYEAGTKNLIDKFIAETKQNFPKADVGKVLESLQTRALSTTPTNFNSLVQTYGQAIIKSIDKALQGNTDNLQRVTSDISTESLPNGEIQKLKAQYFEFVKQREKLEQQKLLVQFKTNKITPENYYTGLSASAEDADKRRTQVTNMVAKNIEANILSELLAKGKPLSTKDLRKKYSADEIKNLLTPYFNTRRGELLNKRTNQLTKVAFDEIALKELKLALAEAQERSVDIEGTSPAGRLEAHKQYLALLNEVNQKETEIINKKQKIENEYLAGVTKLIDLFTEIYNNAQPVTKIKIKELKTTLEKLVAASEKVSSQLEEDSSNQRKDHKNRIKQGNLDGFRGYDRSAAYRRAKASIDGGDYVDSAGEVQSITVGDSQVGNALDYINAELKDTYSGFDALASMSMELVGIGNNLGNSFGDAFASFVTGTQSAEQAFRGLATSMLSQMAAIAARAAANQALSYLFSGFGAAAGGGADTGGDYSSAPTIPRYNGGLITAGRFASGGLITSGISSRDSTLAHVAKGEFVLRKRAVDAIGLDTVRSLNNLDSSSIKNGEATLGDKSLLPEKTSSGDSGVVNVWVVSESEKPQTLKPNDIVAVISENISKGGHVKQLIKQVQMGR